MRIMTNTRRYTPRSSASRRCGYLCRWGLVARGGTCAATGLPPRPELGCCPPRAGVLLTPAPLALQLGCIAVVGATAYTMAVVSAYCTGELLGLPRGWVGLLFRGIATSRTAWLVYGLVGGGYATAGYVLGFDRVKNLIRQEPQTQRVGIDIKGRRRYFCRRADSSLFLSLGRKALHQVLPGYASQDAIQEQDIFVVLKGGKVWHEPLGGGPVSGPLEIPLLDVNTAAAFEYDGEVFAISSDGKLSKPLLARGTNDPERPFADLPGMSSRIYAMMDWSTQAVFIYNNRIYLIKDGKVRKPSPGRCTGSGLALAFRR